MTCPVVPISTQRCPGGLGQHAASRRFVWKTGIVCDRTVEGKMDCSDSLRDAWPVRSAERTQTSTFVCLEKGLTTSLRSLEAAKVIVRRDLSASVLHVEYELSEAIRTSLVALLDHIADWGNFYEAAWTKQVVVDQHSSRMSE